MVNKKTFVIYKESNIFFNIFQILKEIFEIKDLFACSGV